MIQFTGTLNQLGRPYVKFYDKTNSWYLDESWKEKIQDAIDLYGRPELTIGYSMGGWAALFHQWQIQADKVLAFVPQGTTISEEILAIGGQGSKSWAKDLKNIKGCRLPPPFGKHTIYFGNHKEDGTGDNGHKKLLIESGYQTTTIKVPEPNEHNILLQLHQQKKLVDLIKSHLDNT